MNHKKAVTRFAVAALAIFALSPQALANGPENNNIEGQQDFAGASLNVTPSDNLTDTATVNFEATGLPPNQAAYSIQCGPPGGPTVCSAFALIPGGTGASGTISGTKTVRRVLPTEPEVTCTGTTAANTCFLTITNIPAGLDDNDPLRYTVSHRLCFGGSNCFKGTPAPTTSTTAVPPPTTNATTTTRPATTTTVAGATTTTVAGATTTTVAGATTTTVAGATTTTVAGATTTTVAGATTTTVAGEDEGECAAATLVGTDGDDVLTGTSGDDVIDGRDGNDIINGLGGKDTICGKQGKDLILGGRGNDRLFGGGGHDKILGGPGADRIAGGSGYDACLGGPGRDRSVDCEFDVK